MCCDMIGWQITNKEVTEDCLTWVTLVRSLGRMYRKLYILLLVFILVYNDRVDGQMKKEVKKPIQISKFMKFGCNFVVN